MCEKCWGDAYLRHLNFPGRTQSDHYHDLLAERAANPCTKEQQEGQFHEDNVS